MAQPGFEPPRLNFNCHAVCIFILDGNSRGERKTLVKGGCWGEDCRRSSLRKARWDGAWGGRAEEWSVVSKHRPCSAQDAVGQGAGLQDRRGPSLREEGPGVLAVFRGGRAGADRESPGLHRAYLDLRPRVQVYIALLQPLCRV